MLLFLKNVVRNVRPLEGVVCLSGTTEEEWDDMDIGHGRPNWIISTTGDFRRTVFFHFGWIFQTAAPVTAVV